jgi:hypothetical protein
MFDGEALSLKTKPCHYVYMGVHGNKGINCLTRTYTENHPRSDQECKQGLPPGLLNPARTRATSRPTGRQLLAFQHLASMKQLRAWASLSQCFVNVWNPELKDICQSIQG